MLKKVNDKKKTIKLPKSFKKASVGEDEEEIEPLGEEVDEEEEPREDEEDEDEDEPEEEKEESEEEVIKKEIKKNSKSPKSLVQVVGKLPVQEIRELRQEDGTILKFVTVEEYLTELANK